MGFGSKTCDFEAFREAGIGVLGPDGEEATGRIRETISNTTTLRVASKPEDIADAALFLISDASRHVTGETLLIDAGLHLGVSPQARR